MSGQGDGERGQGGAPGSAAALGAWDDAGLEPDALEPSRVLVVDDEPVVRRTSERALRSDMLIIDMAESGAQALQALGGHDYAVILTDYRMEGMDGIELCERVALRAPDTVCLLVTGHGDLQVALAAVNRGRVFRFLPTLLGRRNRKALAPSVAREEIARCRGKQFDPRCAEAFLAIPQEELDELRARVATQQHAGLD